MEQPKNNKFIQKFERKEIDELLDYVENPNRYQPEAIEAAKWLLEIKTEEGAKIESEEKKIEPKIIEPKLIEKAFFKSKWLYYCSCILLFVYASILILASFISPSVYTYIWAVIFSVSLIVVISKHKSTVIYLKVLSGLALSALLAQYVIYFSNNYYFSFAEELITLLKEDFKTILLSLIIIFFSDQFIENRMVKK
ncbi:hypothetical protein [Robertkochia flava]|uniref:hypothetical protein n=1 Tax=Robertkochia flava TaxID=3447986 RepID=UPI001CC93F74|nr:hypothetical protein [Robertkochia marina]